MKMIIYSSEMNIKINESGLKELFEKQSANMEDYITAANMPTPKPKGAKDLLIETNFDPEILKPLPFG